jgi:hypothetical protein
MKNNSIISKLQISGKLRQTFGNAGNHGWVGFLQGDFIIFRPKGGGDIQIWVFFVIQN